MTRRLPLPAPAPPSWWLGEALAAEGNTPSTRPLQGELDVDVAIVGGGYTGLWTALALREREPSLSVAVLEAHAVGLGPSGRNGGFLHGYWSSLARLRELLGDARALELARVSSRIVPAVRAFCQARGADVWLREAGLLQVSASPAEDAAVARAVEAARELGVEEEAVPLTREDVRARCDSPRFRAGVRFRDGATVQPARLARALRRAALSDGVQVFEHTPVLGVQSGRVTTREGHVQAKEIVLAAGAWGTGTRPVSRRQTVFGSAVVLTEPVPELLEEIGWTGGEAILDGRMFLHYFRTSPDGRVLMGSGSGALARGGAIGSSVLDDGPAQGRAEAGLRRLLPALASAGVDARWSGPIDVSADRLPFFGTVPGSRIHFGSGYTGNGAGPSWLGGQILASLVLGSDDEWTALPLVRRRARRLPPEPLRYAGGVVVRAATLTCEAARADGRRPPLAARAAAALPRLLRMPLGTR